MRSTMVASSFFSAMVRPRALAAGTSRLVSRGCFARSSFAAAPAPRSEEHTSELQSHRDLHSFPTRRSSDLLFLGHGETARLGRWNVASRQQRLLRALFFRGGAGP